MMRSFIFANVKNIRGLSLRTFAAPPPYAAPEPEEHPLVAALRELQPDDLSPRDALERIYRLRKLV